MTTVLREHRYSRVWREEGSPWVYKRQHEFMTRNEFYFLTKMFKTGYVPLAEMAGRDLLKIQYYPQEEVTDKAIFMAHFRPLLHALRDEGIRHGDLTVYAIRVFENKPYLIDFAESRLWADPRPDKRPEGDSYWLKRSMKELSVLA